MSGAHFRLQGIGSSGFDPSKLSLLPGGEAAARGSAERAIEAVEAQSPEQRRAAQKPRAALNLGGGEGAKFGPPLIFLHGALGHKRNFQSLARAFGKTHTTLVYDQPCHGLSPHFSPPFTLRRLAEAAKALAGALFPRQKASLIGHSLGGWTALLFGSLWPEQTAKIVVADASPWPVEERLKRIEGILSLLPPSFPGRREARLFLEKQAREGALSRKMAEFLYGGLQNQKTHISLGFDKKGVLAFAESARTQDLPSLVKSLKIPALFLRGSQSRTSSKRTLKGLRG